MTGRGSPPRAVICDGASGDAAVLRRALAHDGEIEVVGVFGTFAELLAALPEAHPALVVLDIEHAGFESAAGVSSAIRGISVPILVMHGDAAGKDGRTAAALAGGAPEALPRHRLSLDDPRGRDAAMLRRTVRRLSASAAPRPSPTLPRAARVSRPVMPGPRAPRQTTVVGICASTGGPGTLEELLGALPADYPVPILVVQHISTGFLDGLIKLLNSRVALRVAVARHGADAEPGIWFAPDGAHLTVEEGMRLALDRRTVVGPHRPSGDLLLGSLAKSAGRRATGVVLTGMGRDGARGGAALRGAGGLLLAQDPDTATAYGMPRAAVRAGAEALTITEIVATLLDVTANGA